MPPLKINADGTLPWKRDALGHPYLDPEVETAIVSAGGPHDHDGEYAAVDHAHGGGAGAVSEHPDLAAHQLLGLASEHPHDFAASGHGHDTSHDHDQAYAGTAHNHDAAYAAPHGHPYAADDHSHPAGSHPDLATHEQLGLVTDTDLTNHAGTVHGTQPHAIDGAAHTGSLTAAAVGAAAAGHNHDAAYSATSHSHALTDPDIPAGIARDSEVTSAIATHAATPHGGGGERYKVGDLYLTTTAYADGAAVAAAEGYGTWQRFGVGRFLLLTDGTAGQTGGSATHAHSFTQPSDHAALTHAGTAVANHSVTQPAAHTEVINHTHSTDSQGAHVHDEFRNSATTGGLDGWAAGDTSTNTPTLTGYDTGSAGAHTHTAQNPAGGVSSIAHTGTAVDAHQVTQPSGHAAQSHSGGAVADGSTDPLSITAYCWQRTA